MDQLGGSGIGSPDRGTPAAADRTGADPDGEGNRVLDRPRRGATGRVVLGKHYGAGMVERHGPRRPRELWQPAFTITGADGGGSKRLSWQYVPKPDNDV